MIELSGCLGRIKLQFFFTLIVSMLNFTMSESEKTTRPGSPASIPQEEKPAEVICSDMILQGKQEVLIQHGETTYRLRITQNGKLILCK